MHVLFRLFTSLVLFSVFFVPCVLFANYETFTQVLQKVGINVANLAQSSSISRFEMARLLNAIECEDCIIPSPWTQQHYSFQFWTDFSKMPNRDFQDITYRSTWWTQKDYYYCVAYVGESEYMRGYPAATSPTCGGKFCGQNSISKSEFFQTVLNIIDEGIMQHYSAKWSAIQAWFAKLTPGSYTYKVLSDRDIQAIKMADSKSTSITTSDQFQVYLKYCMFNLSECSFQTFGNIGYGYWPVSELNVLMKEGVITRADTENVSSNLKGADALKILYYVYRNYSKCTVNDDYDCDAVVNTQDNCPYTYNPGQRDVDGDTQGNVCDDDIDGDGQKNPEGIVDDNDNIIIDKWDAGSDQTPLGDGKKGFWLFINVQSLTDTLPAIISAKVLTDGDLQSLQWSMGDGATYSTTLSNILHTYKSSGTYTISVLATDQTGKKAEASTKVYIAPGSNLFYQLAIQPTFTFQNGGVEYHFSVASQGDLDRVVWSFNTPEVRETPIGGSITQTFSGTTMVVVHAKAYAQGALKAVASTNIFPSATPRFASLQVVAGSLQVPTKVTTTLAGLKMQSVQNILRDRGDGMITSGTELTVTHLYTSSGIKTLRQTLFLQDAQPLENIITFFVENPFASHSVALNIVGTQFSYPQAQPVKFTLSLLSRSPAGLPTPIRIANTFAINQSQTFSATPLSKIVLQYVYPDAGTKSITSFGEINRCVSLFNQGTVYISAEDRCLAALKNGRLTQYQCDMDSDGIPDLCDDDLDGDGKKNLLGLVKYEKADCSYDNDNVDGSILRKHFGVCSLDNCPFVKNADQSDLNNNGIGEVCEAWTKTIVATPGETDTLWKYDQDKDGIPDDVDLCPTIPGDRVHQGCPSFWNGGRTDLCESAVPATCGDGKLDAGETCLTCPEDTGFTCFVCGNMVCEAGESNVNCPVDCPPSDEKCGNGVLDLWETCRDCPADTGPCQPVCGDGKCEVGESNVNCSADCPPSDEKCGNGVLDTWETCRDCPADTGPCQPVCGDGKCEVGESNANCSADCPSIIATCGDGTLDAGENCFTCPVDAQPCFPVDARCDDSCGVNDCTVCPTDCSTTDVCLAYCVQNGKKDPLETCDPTDTTKQWRGNKGCSDFCLPLSVKESDNPDCDGVCGVNDCNVCLSDCDKTDICLAYCVQNGKKDPLETCDPTDMTHQGRGSKGCSAMCQPLSPADTENPDCDGVCGVNDCNVCLSDCDKTDICLAYCIPNGVRDAGEVCDPSEAGCNAFCQRITPPSGCDGVCWPDDCDLCPTDCNQTNRCITYCGNGSVDLGEECDDGSLNGKNGHCSMVCKLETCGNGIVDAGETCGNCPQDVQWCIVEQNCNICPCPYADFASDLISKDRVRVKLRDSSRKVFYRFSPEVLISNFL